jgi:hypothetical protein
VVTPDLPGMPRASGCLLLVAVGVLSGLGVIGSFHLG